MSSYLKSGGENSVKHKVWSDLSINIYSPSKWHISLYLCCHFFVRPISYFLMLSYKHWTLNNICKLDEPILVIGEFETPLLRNLRLLCSTRRNWGILRHAELINRETWQINMFSWQAYGIFIHDIGLTTNLLKSTLSINRSLMVLGRARNSWRKCFVMLSTYLMNSQWIFEIECTLHHAHSRGLRMTILRATRRSHVPISAGKCGGVRVPYLHTTWKCNDT